MELLKGGLRGTERQADALAAVWQTTEFTYDVLNKLKTVKDPLNRVTTYNYDNNENLASVVGMPKVLRGTHDVTRTKGLKA